MKIILRPERGGKTTELIRCANGKNGYIVCMDRVESHRVMQRAQDIGCDINFPITFDEFLSHRYYSAGIRKFFIDNVDVLLDTISNVPIDMITMSSEGKNDNKIMMQFLKGGNWQDGSYAGSFSFSFTDPRAYRELVPFGVLGVDGLPERWVKILRGETNWIPKIVFKLKK